MRGLIDYADTLIAGPTLEPLDLEETKKLLKFTPTSEDTLIDLWISAARQHFEAQTGRQLLTATWERWLTGFPDGGVIELPHPPLQSVVSVTYGDTGTETIWDAAEYVVSAPMASHGPPGRIALAVNGSWPTVTRQMNAVRIRYTAGYGDAPGAVPELVKGALYLLVGHFHRFRAEVQVGAVAQLPMGSAMILRAFRNSALPTLGPMRSWASELDGLTWPA